MKPACCSSKNQCRRRIAKTIQPALLARKAIQLQAAKSPLVASSQAPVRPARAEKPSNAQRLNMRQSTMYVTTVRAWQ